MSNNKGIIAVYATIILIFAGLCGITIMRYLSPNLKLQKRRIIKLKNECTIESGFEIGLFNINKDVLFRADGTETCPFINYRFNERDIKVSVCEINGQKSRLVICSELKNGDQKSIQVSVNTPLLYTIVTKNRLNQNFLSVIKGDVYIEKEGEFEGSIQGYVSCIENTDINGKDIRKSITTEKLIIPEYDRNWIEKQDDMIRILNSRVTELKLRDKKLYRRGNLTISDSDLKDCCIFVDGDLTIENRFNLSSTKYVPSIVVLGDIFIVTDNAELEGLIDATGKITLNGTGSVKGTIISESLEIYGKWDFNWNKELLYKFPHIKPEIKITRF
ncbi:MAG: hypothetical protein AB1765_02295 [Candidatus Hydrogenedentota bacterium]